MVGAGFSLRNAKLFRVHNSLKGIHMKRRTFLKTAAIGAASTTLAGAGLSSNESISEQAGKGGPRGPIILSTWNYGRAVSEAAYNKITGNGSVLDAVEAAVRIPEADPNVNSVGYGGYPDRDGKVTLDACIMDGNGNCGSVVFLEHIMHPVSVARLVMEQTPHVILAGEGALQFALSHGFQKENLLTEKSKAAYERRLKAGNFLPPGAMKDDHDTIGLLAMDGNGSFAGACSTSGLAWKLRGRVGDSPIIGAGLFVDNEAGAATATGLGEAVIKIAGTAMIVEMMRAGKSPQQACRLAIERLVRKQPKYKEIDDFLVGFIAMNREGDTGGYSYKKGFQYAKFQDGEYTVIDAGHMA
jgi:isoaspartyl peptidase/L-asparaginase-like protein (Ntn-hydrolase superfamily)